MLHDYSNYEVIFFFDLSENIMAALRTLKFITYKKINWFKFVASRSREHTSC